MSRTVDRLTVRRLVNEYCYAVDDDRLGDFVDLYADDGWFEMTELDRPVGRAALRDVV